MEKSRPRTVWRLDADSRLVPLANGRAWRVVAADRDRADTHAEYLFCPPDFLFPAEGVGRALRLELDRRPTPRAPASRISSRRAG